MEKALEKLKVGDHAALFYQTRAEQFAAIVPYIRTGLERRERCLYIADDNSVRMVWNALEEGGIDVRRAEQCGALSIVTKQETYLRHGIFEPVKMISDLGAEVKTSLRRGFTALRATGEMTWALSHPSSLARLIEYEFGLDFKFPAQFIGLCQFNETAFPAQIISEAIRTHPIVVARGRVMKNPFYPPSATAPHPLVEVEQVVACA